jgi:competence protein ComEA
MASARVLTLLTTSLLICISAHALEVNDATEAQLDGMRGLGPSQTARILQAREAGPFINWADFMARVKGVKAPTARKLSAQGLTVGGTPYPGAPQ